MTCPSSVGASRPSKAGRRPGVLAPLARRDFALLWVGTGLSLAGDGIYAVALAWQVYELSGAAGALAAVGLAWALPQLALLPWAGIAADRHDRRRLLIGADLARAAAIAALGGLAMGGALDLWSVGALVVVYGVAEAFAAPAFVALVPRVVPRDELVPANALEQSARPLALRLAGPAAGGVLVAWIGAGGALLVDAATFALCAAAIAAMRVPAGAPAAPRDWRAELAEAARYVRERAWLWTTLVAAAVGLLCFYGPVTVLLPWVVKHELGAGAGALGLILAAGGAGALVAALAVGQLGLPGPPLRAVYASWTAGALAIAGFGLAGAVWQAVLASVVVQGAMTVGAIAWGALLQRAVPERLLGRVSSLDWLVSTGLVPVSLALTAPAAALLGPRAVLVAAGALGGAALGLLGVAANAQQVLSASRRFARPRLRALIRLGRNRARSAEPVPVRRLLSPVTVRRFSPVRRLRTALAEEQLEVHYQPKVELRTERVAGVEALLRWRHPRLGMLTPGSFLDGLEHHEVLDEVARFVLDSALDQTARWRDAGAPLSVAVNVASASLVDESLPRTVDAALSRWGVPPDALVMEITETAVLHDPERAAGVVHDLVALGVGVSLDDFGTGESSLSRLLRFPIVELKIDRTFVHNLAVHRSRGTKVVRAVVDLAHDLGHRVVAEGVEDRATLDRLADLDCDQAQGYYLCRPVPASRLPDWAVRPGVAADRLFSRPLGSRAGDALGGAFRSPAAAPTWH